MYAVKYWHLVVNERKCILSNSLIFVLASVLSLLDPHNSKENYIMYPDHAPGDLLNLPQVGEKVNLIVILLI